MEENTPQFLLNFQTIVDMACDQHVDLICLLYLHPLVWSPG